MEVGRSTLTSKATDNNPPTHKIISSPRFIATLKKLSFFLFLVRTIDAKKGGRKNPQKHLTGKLATCSATWSVRYASEWPISEFREHGVVYSQCEENKSELYLAFIPVTNSRGVELPDDKRLLTQLRRLERKRGRAGKDTVDHPPRLHDDLSNAVAGVSHLLSTAKNARPEFNPALHIAREKLRLAAGNWPVVIGISYDEGIAASIIGQMYNNGQIRILAAFLSEGVSLRRHLLEHTKPWLSTHAHLSSRLQMLGAYEDTTDLEKKSATRRTAQEILSGEWALISKSWEIRRDAMLDILTKAAPFTFRPVVQFDPVSASVLSQALNGRLYEKDKVEKKNSHVINAFGLLLARIEHWKAQPKTAVAQRVPPSWMSA